jgi:hypothetical protein
VSSNGDLKSLSKNIKAVFFDDYAVELAFYPIENDASDFGQSLERTNEYRYQARNLQGGGSEFHLIISVFIS